MNDKIPKLNKADEGGSSRTTWAALGVGYKILIQQSIHAGPQTWRILGIQNGLALVSEGWGIRKMVLVESILSERFFVLESKAPWWLRFFLPPNAQTQAPT